MKTKVTIFLIVIFAAILRIYNIEQKNLWFDEVFSWKISQGSIKEIVSETSGDIHPPLFYIALKLWTVFFTDGIFSMRMLSVILSLLSIYFIYKLSRLCLKNDVQIIAVLLLFALSPLNIYYSQEVRMLNMNLFLCLGSVYYFLKLSKHYDLEYGLL
ncbi:MAG: glycosyltransferase family 39 protein, partial [Bacteroidota bacterium]|nr:glycosyltransferase family 39 protein [Bacteroidota bacterium]